MQPLRTTRPAARALAALAGAAALAAGLAAAGCGQTPGAAGAPVPAAAIGRLTAIAHRAATINGDPNPAWITAVLTTHAKALTSATPGDYVPGSAHVKVFLITMRGRFTAKGATGPPGAKAPAGRYLSLVVDATTFQGLDFGIALKPPPVPPASLGPVTYLHWPQQGPPAPAAARLPRFFADFPVAGVGAGPVQIRDAATGKLVAQDASTFGTTAVAAQADGLHFVLAKLSGSGCLSRFYRVGINGQGQPGRLQVLTAPALHGTVLGLAASADGRTLAYALMGCGKGTPSYLGVVDTRAGRIRQWGGVSVDGEGQGSAIVGSYVSLTADGRWLAYHLTTPNGGWTSIMVLPTGSAPGSAVQRSRAVAGFGPGSRVLASGLLCLAGHTVGAYTLSGTATPPRLMLAEYSTATGRRLRASGRPPGLRVTGPGCFLSPGRSGRYLLESSYSLPSYTHSHAVAVLRLTRADLLTGKVSTLTVTTPSGQMSSIVSGMIAAW